DHLPPRGDQHSELVVSLLARLFLVPAAAACGREPGIVRNSTYAPGDDGLPQRLEGHRAASCGVPSLDAGGATDFSAARRGAALKRCVWTGKARARGLRPS